MLYSEYTALRDDGIEFGFDSDIAITEFMGECAANDLVALPLTTVSPKYARDLIIDICLSGGVVIAFLLTCKGREFGYGSASSELVAAYLQEASRSDITDIHGNELRNYKFTNDYVVVSVVNHSDYITNYRPGSAVWGSFTHREEQPSKALRYISLNPKIVATPGVRITTDTQKDSLWRAISHSSPLERFLKLYHLLELNFDLEIIKKLKGLGDDLKGIGKILNSYSGDKEFDRLLKVIREYCTDLSFFERVLGDVFRDPKYHDQLYDILFEYSKESNPYKDHGAKFKRLLAMGFSCANLSACRLSNDYDNLSKFAGYIIYRIRSSIAHFRIGEYLLVSTDEEFVSEAIEPLLREVLLQLYDSSP